MKIPPDVYRERRKRLMASVGGGLIVIPPHPFLIYANDKMVKYRPHANTIYFSGIQQHDTIIVLDANQFKSFLFILDKDPELELWHGRRLERVEAGEISGIELVYYLSEFELKLQDLLKPVSKLFMDWSVNIHVDGILTKHLQNYSIIKYPLQNRTDQMRLIKDDLELAIIKKSVDLSVQAHMKAISQTKVGISEAELESIYACYFRVNGAVLPTYEANVSSGPSTVILHHSPTVRQVKEKELILVDCGAEYQNYTADIARTWPVSGKFTAAQSELYDIVLRTNKKCIEMVRPGIKFWDIHEAAVSMLVDGLIEVNLLDGEKEDLIEQNDFKKFFPHGIGHFLGMDGHDTPTIPRKEIVLQPGMYITIEPGLYIPDFAGIPKKFHNIGIRIEDNILVTKDGYENLSISLPKEQKELEALTGSLV